jgi:hypothetical protein
MILLCMIVNLLGSIKNLQYYFLQNLSSIIINYPGS